VTEWTVIAVLAIVMLGGLVKGFSGFGPSLVLGGLLLLFYDPVTIVPVLALLSFTMNTFILVEQWKRTRHDPASFAFRPETLVALLVGTAIGVQALVALPVGVVKVVFGLLIVTFIALYFKQPRFMTRTRVSARLQHGVVGLVAGFFSGLINTNGPPIVLYGLYRRLDKNRFLGVITRFFLVADALAIGLFAVKGLYGAEQWSYFLWFIPVALAGFLIGKGVRLKASEKAFHQAVVAFLLLIAVKTVADGVALIA